MTISIRWKDGQAPTINVNAITDRQKSVFLKRVMLDFKDRLDENISQGKGADDKEIKRGGYSESYKKFRRERGRNDSPVDLTFTGELLRSRQIRASKGSAELYFSGNHSTAGSIESSKPKTKSSTIKSSKDKKSSKKAKGLSNAALAIRLMARGFLHWHEFGKQDKKIFQDSFTEFVDRNLAKKLFEKG